MQVLALAKYLSMASRAGCAKTFEIMAISCKSESNRFVLWYVIVFMFYDANIRHNELTTVILLIFFLNVYGIRNDIVFAWLFGLYFLLDNFIGNP